MRTPTPSSLRPSTPATTPTSTHRSQFIDTVKGLAIALVVLGHTNQGELSRGWWGSSSFGLHLNAFIYAFHMPAFFFISGVLLPGSVHRRGARGYVLQRARTLLYPFVLWSVLMPIAEHLLVRYKHANPPSLHSSLLNLVTGDNAWFLPALFVALVLGMLLRPIPIPALFCISWAAAWFCPHTRILALDRGVEHLPFVIAGMWFNTYLPRLERISCRMSLAIALAVGIFLSLAAAVVTSGAVIRWALLPAGFVGTAMLLLLAHGLQNTRAAEASAWVGIASIAVFLLSPFPQGAARTLLQAVHCTQPIVQLLVPSLAAIALSAWLYHSRQRLHLTALFAWPTHANQPESEQQSVEAISPPRFS